MSPISTFVLDTLTLKSVHVSTYCSLALDSTHLHLKVSVTWALEKNSTGGTAVN